MGFHVIHVEKVEPGKLIPLDRVAGKIRNKLYSAKFAKRRREWIAELKRTAFLEIHYDPKASGGGLASIFKDVREQVTFHLVRIRLRESRGLLGRDRIFWTYGAHQRSPRWKSDRLRVDDKHTLGKDEIGALAPTQRSFVNPDPLGEHLPVQPSVPVP